jgi:hydrogenase/urease accessory protein HupE
VACGAAAPACGIGGTEFDVGIDFKPVSQKIDLYGLRFLIKFFFHDKLETIYVEYIIVVFGLIQSHSQGRAASTACIQKDPYGCGFFAIKVFLNLFGRFFRNFHHNILILLAYFQLSSGTGRFC